MNAVVFEKTLRFDSERSDPIVSADECLVRVHLAGICATDLEITRGYMGFAGVLGHEMVGSVIEGPDAWRGKRVVCEINCVCRTCDMCQAGLSNHCRKRTVFGISGRDGFFADLAAVPLTNLHEVPDVLTDEQAVFTEPVAAAYQVLAQCAVDSRSTVSVVGAGRLGLLVAQALKAKGCRLTVIGRHEAKLALCEKRGIQGVQVRDVVPQHNRDVVVECSGSPDGLRVAMQLVRPRGTIVLKSTYARDAQLNLAPIVIDEVSVLGSRCGPFPVALDALAREEVEVRPMISKTFPLENAVEAFEFARDPQSVKVLLKPAGRQSG